MKKLYKNLNKMQMKKAMNLDLLSMREKREALESAKVALPMGDQIEIDGMVQELIEVIKEKRPTSQFSNSGALEVIAKIGIFMNAGKN